MELWKRNLYILWVSQILANISFNLGIPFLPYFIQELGVTSPASIKMYSGLLNAVGNIAGCVAAPMWGILADKYGKKLMLLRAMFFGIIIVGGMGIATCVQQLIALRFIQGIFTGTVTAAAVLVAAYTPGNKLSYALGIISSSNFIGMSLGPTLGGFIAEGVGYRRSFFIGAALMIFDFFLVLFLVKENKTSHQNTTSRSKEKISVWSIFTKSIVILIGVLFLTTIARTIFSSFLPLYVQEIRKTTRGSATVTGIINGIVGLMVAISGIVFGKIGDRRNKIKLLSVLMLSGMIISLPMTLTQNLFIFSVIYGTLFFAIGGIEPIITASNSMSVPPEKRGTLFGIQTFISNFGSGIAPIIGGMISISYSLKSILYVIPALLGIAAVIMCILGKKSGRGLKKI